MNTRAGIRRLPLSALLLILLLAAPGCREDSGTIVIKLGHGLDPTHPVHQAMEFMAQYLAERSSGRLRLDIYPSEQLGSERECLELLQIGSLGMTKVSCSVLEGFVPAMSVLSLPYLFRDSDHRYRVLEGEIGRRLLLEGERFWLRGLCYYDAGSRSFYTKEHPVLTPDDLKGVKVRTQESPTSIRMVQALGGSPTPIAWGELYSALQQGVVDGAENNPPSFYLSRHYEVCRHYSLDEHTAVPDALLISTHLWRDLSPEFRALVQAAALASARVQKRLWREATEEALSEVEKAGVQIHYPDKKPFMERVGPLYAGYRDRPDLYGLIREIQEIR
jgi:tripartite ATP-independent transporter DctP family solute receptor